MACLAVTSAARSIYLGYVPICLIYRFLESDKDRIELFYICKKLMNKRYLVLDDGVYQLEKFKYQSIVDCCVRLAVGNDHLKHLYNLLYNNTNTLVASLNAKTIDYIRPEVSSVAAAEAVQAWKHGARANILPRLQTLVIDKSNDIAFLTSQQIVDFASYIPPCVTTIVFNVDFIEPIATNLPSTIKSIAFKRCYNKSITRSSFPPTLQSLHLGAYFNMPIRGGDLPIGLLDLQIGSGYSHPLPVGALPPHIHSLTFLTRNFVKDSVHFPHTVRKLVLSSVRSIQKEEFPPNLEYLEFYDASPEIIKGSLPTSLRKLVLQGPFKLDSPDILPPNLTHLRFDDKSNSGIIKYLLIVCKPESITHLNFGLYFNSKLPTPLPSNLVELVFGSLFNQPIQEGDLPESLEYLAFGDGFKKKLPISMPKGLKRLVLGKSFDVSNIRKHSFPSLEHITVWSTPSIMHKKGPTIPTTCSVVYQSGLITEPKFYNDYHISLPPPPPIPSPQTL
ncbi:hypothetical protein DFA_00504 [Cavenderia fasciculata]|uniref:FNIP repeat-containing protein n=1 Tax=Cavenderia fasciculata TaxID=261658 RepID=F4PS97_CACFS|nr:uncharacterized protein DFA_00504 [Cavenderia fasciculata]EGG20643.1 hypothetical protein DFA_00504 [Cavenderia fasciculata]|eukprot:XP_004358493.1 hypothetical protein DFA_00504 [Cavenderia fasciculata]